MRSRPCFRAVRHEVLFCAALVLPTVLCQDAINLLQQSPHFRPTAISTQHLYHVSPTVSAPPTQSEIWGTRTRCQGCCGVGHQRRSFRPGWRKLLARGSHWWNQPRFIYPRNRMPAEAPPRSMKEHYAIMQNITSDSRLDQSAAS